MNDMADVREGQSVWAKLKGFDWWPGMVVPASLCRAMIGSNDIHLCLYWYGHNSVSELKPSVKVMDFVKGFQRHNRKNGTKASKYGVIQAAKDLMLMHKLTVHKDVSNQQVLAWMSSDDFKFLDVKEEELKVSVFVQHQLKLLTARFSSESKCCTRTKESSTNCESSQSKCLNNLGMCSSCGSSDSETFCDHPIFDKRICSSCLAKFKEDYFVPKDNGTHGHPFSQLSHGKFVCFLCDKASLGTPVRSCWRVNLFDLFHSRPHIAYQIVESKTHPNLLIFSTSLSTGERLCSYLKEAIGIQYCKLFVCGLPPRQGNATQSNAAQSAVDFYNREIAQNCTVTYLTDVDQFSSMCPSVSVDLVIGSTSGDNSSVVGPYFFKFFQIINLNKECKWLFQMQPPYCKKYITLISRFLESQPGMWLHSDSPSQNCTWTNERSVLKLLQELNIE